MPRNRKLPTSDPTPLRKSKALGDPSEDQEVALAAFLAACAIGYVAVYVTRYAQSGAVKLKLYDNGETYEDVLETNEDWAPLFGDYAKQVGVLAQYQGIYALCAAGRAGRASEAAGVAAEGESSAPPTSKALRGR